jgi:CRP-like cAMP-binding protein
MPPSFIDLFDSQDSGLLSKLKIQMKSRTVQKGEILQYVGDERNHMYYVRKGCLRSYTIDDKGKEHVFMFAPENWIISDIESHVKKTPARLFIDSIEESDIEIIPYNLIDPQLSFSSITHEIGVDKLLNRIATLQHRIIMLMSASALERYEDFLLTYPSLSQRIPQKMIASYLGITPQALSVIRRVKKS